ncbi:phage tail protein [Kineothrix sp. MB12-C1]|uniref:phage tail protein n=1 Tax=Kineothrix sp. MB12-C1 TaxID=3070215 RepID=UPI0027D341B2|nr:hypothetical protein [Kineothrix sp. MB12-C1]WMC91263.1 hypothetical protein RBB56_10240 [Kineothrix sp. MB12-C1]
MGDYAASIRVGTKIETKQASTQLLSLENRLTKTKDKIMSLSDKMKELEQRKAPTKEYKELQTQLEAATKELGNLISRQNDLEAIGIKSGALWNEINEEIASAGIKVDEIKESMERLETAGKAFSLGSDSKEYETVSQQLKHAQNDLMLLQQKHDEAIGKMGTSEQRFGQNAVSTFKKIAESAKSAFGKAASFTRSALSKVSGTFQKIGNVAKGVFQRLHRDTTRQNSLFSTMKSRLGSIALSLLVFNWISKGFRAMIAGMKEGLQNLAQYSREYNAVMSDMVSALATLKNAFATAFAPIATIAIPYITQLINYLTAAVNKVAQFVSALTGKTTWIKAKKQTIDYAQSLNKVSKSAKEAYRSLASFDELNILNKNDIPESETGGIDPSGMFEELPIDSKIKALADKIKDILRGDDWSEIGRMIAAKINEAMKKIPWDKIQPEAKRIASGIATLLNGFIYELDWTLLGYTLAQGLNTALIFLNTFAEKFDWKELGKALSEGINALAEYFDWKLLGDTIKNWWNGIVNFLYELIVGTDWEKLGESIGEAFNTALNGIDWMHTAEMLGEGINSIFEFLLGLGKEIQWGQIGFEISNFLNEGFSSIDAEMAGESVRTWIDGIFHSALMALKNTDWGQVGSGLATFVNESILYADWKQIGATLSELANGFLDFVLEAVETLDWGQVGRDIVDFLINIDWLGLFGRLLVIICEVVLGLREGIEEAFLELASYLPDGFLKGIIEGFLGIDKWIDDHIFRPFIEAIKSLFGIHSPSTVMAEIGKFLISGLIKGIGDKKSDLTDTLTNVYDTVKGILDRLKNFVSDMVSSIKDKISSITSGVSSAWSSVTSWGASSFGRSTNYMMYSDDIPELATGGITTGTTIAKIGEAGREAVLPLENNTGWMDTLADKINGSGTYTFVAEIDGREIFREVIDRGEIYSKSTGKQAFSY